MSKRRHPTMPQRRPVFVGCEGASEVQYVGVLRDLARDQSVPVYVTIQDLGCGAGDPLTRVDLAVRKIKAFEAKRECYADRFVLLDDDQTESKPELADKANRIAHRNGITIVWQSPCFEAVLLRHLSGCTSQRPPSSAVALQRLRAYWPDYEKSMSKAQLARRVDCDALQRVAVEEPALRSLLICLGLVEAQS
jgi:RloB-like protein